MLSGITELNSGKGMNWEAATLIFGLLGVAFGGLSVELKPLLCADEQRLGRACHRPRLDVGV